MNILGIILFIAIVGTALALRFGWRPFSRDAEGNTSPAPENANRRRRLKTLRKVLFWVFVIIIVALLVWGVWRLHEWYEYTYHRPASETPQLVPPGPCQGQWATRTITIPPHGKIVPLCPGWSGKASAGVTITDPSGRSYHDGPHEKSPSINYSGGDREYSFIPDKRRAMTYEVRAQW